MDFTPVLSGTGLVGYRYLERTREEQQQRLADSSVVKRETEGFVEKLNNIQTIDQLMADRDVLTVVLGAFGLQDDIGNPGLIRQVLAADPEDDSSLVNRLPDTRYLDLASAFNFGGEGGPNLDGLVNTNPAVAQLRNYESVDALLAGETAQDRAVLREALAFFEIEQYANNTAFLKKVLESDPTDPGSYLHSLSDKNLLRFSEAFDLKGKQLAQAENANTIYSFAESFRDELPNLVTVDDLFDRPDLLQEALVLFGLEGADSDLDYLRDVLNSDPDDENSVANQAEDKRFAALAGAFEFVERAEHAALIAATPDGQEPPDPYDGLLEKIVEAVDEPLTEPDEYFRNFGFLLYADDFFGLEFFQINTETRNMSQNQYERDYLQRILASDLSDPNSFANFVSQRDPRFENFARAFAVPQPETEGFEYPEGFGQAILDNYLDEKFLTSVGEADPTMRFALGFEPGLEDIVQSGESNDAHWFSIIASNPIREVFEVIFGLPSSFGALDIDRQLSDLKQRAESQFGTDQVAELLQADNVETIRNRYLAQSGLTASAGSNNVLLTLFA